MNEAPEMNTTEQDDKNTSKPFGMGLLGSLFDYLEIFALAIFIVLLVFSFCFRLCRVDGSSMNNTLFDNEYLVASSLFYEPDNGDIVVLHVVNDNYEGHLVKRIIAGEGQNVKIDITEGKVYIDGIEIFEDYVFVDGGVYNNGYFNGEFITVSSENHLIYEVDVPEGKLFIMGDNRNHSMDSRSSVIGLVDKDCVLGKAVLRISPFGLLD